MILCKIVQKKKGQRAKDLPFQDLEAQAKGEGGGGAFVQGTAPNRLGS